MSQAAQDYQPDAVAVVDQAHHLIEYASSSRQNGPMNQNRAPKGHVSAKSGVQFRPGSQQVYARMQDYNYNSNPRFALKRDEILHTGDSNRQKQQDRFILASHANNRTNQKIHASNSFHEKQLTTSMGSDSQFVPQQRHLVPTFDKRSQIQRENLKDKPQFLNQMKIKRFNPQSSKLHQKSFQNYRLNQSAQNVRQPYNQGLVDFETSRAQLDLGQIQGQGLLKREPAQESEAHETRFQNSTTFKFYHSQAVPRQMANLNRSYATSQQQITKANHENQQLLAQRNLQSQKVNLQPRKEIKSHNETYTNLRRKLKRKIQTNKVSRSILKDTKQLQPSAEDLQQMLDREILPSKMPSSGIQSEIRRSSGVSSALKRFDTIGLPQENSIISKQMSPSELRHQNTLQQQKAFDIKIQPVVMQNASNQGETRNSNSQITFPNKTQATSNFQEKSASYEYENQSQAAQNQQVTNQGSMEFAMKSAGSSMNSAQFILKSHNQLSSSAGYKKEQPVENRFYSQLKRHNIPFKTGHAQGKNQLLKSPKSRKFQQPIPGNHRNTLHDSVGLKWLDSENKGQSAFATSVKMQSKIQNSLIRKTDSPEKACDKSETSQNRHQERNMTPKSPTTDYKEYGQIQSAENLRTKNHFLEKTLSPQIKKNQHVFTMSKSRETESDSRDSLFVRDESLLLQKSVVKKRHVANRSRIQHEGNLHKFRDTTHSKMIKQMGEFNRTEFRKTAFDADKTFNTYFKEVYNGPKATQFIKNKQERMTRETRESQQSRNPTHFRNEYRKISQSLERSVQKQENSNEKPTHYFKERRSSQKDRPEKIKSTKWLLQQLVRLPVIAAKSLHDEDALLDSLFMKGCDYMAENKYGKAIECFFAGLVEDDKRQRTASQKSSSSSKSELMSDTGSSLENQKFTNKTDQRLGQVRGKVAQVAFQDAHTIKRDKVDIQSDISDNENLKVPDFLRNLDVKETLNSVQNELRLMRRATKLFKSAEKEKIQEQVSILKTQNNLLKQICLINMSVCFANCGFVKKALLTLDFIDDLHLKTFADFNKAILTMILLEHNILVEEDDDELDSDGESSDVFDLKKKSVKVKGLQHAFIIVRKKQFVCEPQLTPRAGESQAHASQVIDSQRYETKMEQVIGLIMGLVSELEIVDQSGTDNIPSWLPFTNVDSKCLNILTELSFSMQKHMTEHMQQELQFKIEDTLIDKNRQIVTSTEQSRKRDPKFILNEAIQKSLIQILKLVKRLQECKLASKLKKIGLEIELDEKKQAEDVQEISDIKSLKFLRNVHSSSIQAEFESLPSHYDPISTSHRGKIVLQSQKLSKRLQRPRNDQINLNSAAREASTDQQVNPLKVSLAHQKQEILTLAEQDSAYNSVNVLDLPFDQNGATVPRKYTSSGALIRMKKLEQKIIKRAENRDLKKIDKLLKRRQRSEYQKRTAKFHKQIQAMSLEQIESELKIESTINKDHDTQQTTQIKSNSTMRHSRRKTLRKKNMSSNNSANQTGEFVFSALQSCDKNSSQLTIQLPEKESISNLNMTGQKSNEQDSLCTDSSGEEQAVYQNSTQKPAYLRKTEKAQVYESSDSFSKSNSISKSLGASSSNKEESFISADKCDQIQTQKNQKKSPKFTCQIQATQDSQLKPFSSAGNLAIEEFQVLQKDLLQGMQENYGRAMQIEYKQNMQFMKRLTWQITNLKKFDEMKTKMQMKQQIDRLLEIREQTCYKVFLDQLVACVGTNRGISMETRLELKKSYKEALKQVVENQCFSKRLRLKEIQTIVDYKEMLKHGRILDYVNCHYILEKISWFKQFSFNIRQKLLDTSRVVTYEPGQKIFNQGDSSPDMNIILRGSVQVTLQRSDWGDVQIGLPTIFDGQLFGEVSDFSNEQGKLDEASLKQLHMHKYTACAQERCYVLHINKRELTTFSEIDTAAILAERLQFIKGIEIFQKVSLFTLLPITNNLISRKFKLGQTILTAGHVPQGLYIIKKGYCKIGQEQLFKMEPRKTSQEINEKPVMRFNGPHKDPIPHQRRNLKRNNIKANKRLHVVGEEGEPANQYQIEDIIRSETIYRDQLVGKKRYLETLRHFISNYNIHDKELKPFANYETKLNKFNTYFEVGAGEFFGGRVLIAESQLTNEGKEIDKYGNEFIPPSQLSVVANSAEVEVLIMDKNQMNFFPEDVQREILNGLKIVKNYEKPYSNQQRDYVAGKFNEWNQLSKKVMGRAIEGSLPDLMSIEVTGMVNQTPMIDRCQTELFI